jgi:hypothetical protein
VVLLPALSGSEESLHGSLRECSGGIQ